MRTLILTLLALTLSLVSVTLTVPTHCAGAMVALAAEQSMPPPGNPGHKEPPKGLTCINYGKGATKGRICKCHATCVENEDGEIERVEDPQCRAWCFKDRCECLSDCQ